MFQRLDAKKWKYFDWPIALLVLALVAIGLLMIANATGKPKAEEGSGWLEVIASMNLRTTLLNGLWFLLGIGLVAVVLMLDYEIYGRLSPLIYWANIALLAAVLVLGAVRNNAQSWFALGDRAFQPSEIAKLPSSSRWQQLSRYKTA